MGGHGRPAEEVVREHGEEGVEVGSGRLADLAPTLLDLMGIDKPEEMTGESLIR